MTKLQLIKWIDENLFNSTGYINSTKISKKYKFYSDNEFYFNLIKDYTVNIETDDIKERIYCLKNNIILKPKCIECNDTYVSFKSIKEGYRKFCSHKCSNSNPMQKAKNSEINKSKSKQEKELILKKKKQTKLKRYGNENYNNIEKNKKTKEINHGDKTYNNRVKCKQTKLKRYGNENYNNFQQYKLTCLKRYGVENIFQSEDFKSIRKNKCLEKYGVSHEKKLHIQHIDDMNKEFILNRFIDEQGYFLNQECMKYFNISQSSEILLRHRLGIKNKPKLIKSSSKQERYYLELIKSYNIDVIENSRNIISPKELDIYIPRYKLAIEYDGIHWHSFGKSKHDMFNNYYVEDRNHNLEKLLLCSNKDIQLVRIFSSEDNKQDIWKSVLKAKLNLLDNKIYARKCEIKEIESKEASKFLDENHLQGRVNSSIRLGLYYNDVLVSLMTFMKTRYSKEYEYELMRFCSVLNTSVIGGFSRLLKYFEREYKPKSIISYANRRWSKGEVYEKNGFEYLRATAPNYFYFHESKGDKLESRLKYQKHKLKYIEGFKFDDNLTETENMYNNGYRKIYDCGNLVYCKVY